MLKKLKKTPTLTRMKLDMMMGTHKATKMQGNSMEFIAEFLFEKTTKNTVRYMEIPQAGQAVSIGTLYVQKSAFQTKEVPKMLKVTVQVV